MAEQVLTGTVLGRFTLEAAEAAEAGQAQGLLEVLALVVLEVHPTQTQHRGPPIAAVAVEAEHLFQPEEMVAQVALAL
jgi:hypothetical protein